MRVITMRDLIRGVADRWADQYEGKSREMGRDKLVILKKLRALDPETVTPEEVVEIIGFNGAGWGWITSHCDECGEYKREWVVLLGQEPDYDSATVYLCRDCLAKAAALLG